MYRAAQASFVELASSLSDDEWATPVRCTPGWTARDVLSHVAGVTDDIANGRVEGAATEPWTAKQVERWRGAPVDEMVSRWNAQIDAVADALEAIGERRPPLDCHTHEHDVRDAIGRPGNRDGELIHRIVEQFSIGWQGRPIEITFLDGSTTTASGDGEPFRLHGVTPFEVARSRLGRRSRAQVAAWDWSEPFGDDEFAAWFAFGPTAVDIVE